MQTLANPKPSQRRSHPAIRVRSTVSDWALPLRETGMAEQWAPIDGHPEYWVSSDGRVESRKWGKSRYLVPIVHRKGGYLRVGLTEHDHKRHRFIHDLVLEAFVGKPPQGFQCCHTNGISTDNRLDNLRWGTSKDNAADSARLGVQPRGEKIGIHKLTEARVRTIRNLYGTMPAKAIASIVGVVTRTVYDVQTRKTWSHL